MRRLWIAAIVGFALVSMLSACSAGDGTDSSRSARVVEDYLQALMAKDASRLASLTCADFESEALVELDSFQAVRARLEGLLCQQTGVEGNNLLVVCQGKIIATYDNEDQEIDLAVRTYQVVEQAGEFLVCGYR